MSREFVQAVSLMGQVTWILAVFSQVMLSPWITGSTVFVILSGRNSMDILSPVAVFQMPNPQCISANSLNVLPAPVESSLQRWVMMDIRNGAIVIIVMML